MYAAYLVSYHETNSGSNLDGNAFLVSIRLPACHRKPNFATKIPHLLFFFSSSLDSHPVPFCLT